jgi:hypothetical protein
MSGEMTVLIWPATTFENCKLRVYRMKGGLSFLELGLKLGSQHVAAQYLTLTRLDDGARSPVIHPRFLLRSEDFRERDGHE